MAEGGLMVSAPEPGTREARAAGCSCWLTPPSRWGFDPDPTVRRDEWCPLHGRDPDYEREKRRDGL